MTPTGTEIEIQDPAPADGGTPSGGIPNPFRKKPGPKPGKGRRRAPAAPRTPREPAGKKNLAPGLTAAYGLLATGISMGMKVPVYGPNPENPAEIVQVGTQSSMVGQIMQVQAPAAGRQLHNLIKEHPRIHEALSPIFGAAEFQTLTDVVAPPLIVFLLERRPDLYPVFRPMLIPLFHKLYLELQRSDKEQEKILAAITGAGTGRDEGFQSFLDLIGFGETAPPEQPAPDSPYREPAGDPLGVG